MGTPHLWLAALGDPLLRGAFGDLAPPQTSQAHGCDAAFAADYLFGRLPSCSSNLLSHHRIFGRRNAESVYRLVLGACGMGWLASLNSRTVLAAIPCLVISVVGHTLSVRAWQIASDTMYDAQASIPTFRRRSPRKSSYPLMLPDHRATSLSTKCAGRHRGTPTWVADFTSRGVGMTRCSLTNGPQHFGSGTVNKLKGHALRCQISLGVACWNPVEKQFSLLSSPYSNNAGIWQSKVLADAVKRGCVL